MVQERLFDYVKAMGIKQKAIADNCDMTEMAVSNAARGERRLMADEFYRICKFLGKSMDDFGN